MRWPYARIWEYEQMLINEILSGNERQTREAEAARKTAEAAERWGRRG